ncbi:EpsG family protein [Pedobacter sp. NJ-S-72]
MYAGIKKYTTHTSIALIVFMLIPGLYLNTLSIIRQELAIVITFYAFHFLAEKKYLKYFLLIALGTSFHYSCALIMLGHLLVWKFADRVKVWHYFLAIGVSLVIAKLELTSVLTLVLGGGQYESYIEGESVNFLKLIVLNTFLITQLVFYYKLVRKTETNKYVIAFTVLGNFITEYVFFFTDFNQTGLLFQDF